MHQQLHRRRRHFLHREHAGTAVGRLYPSQHRLNDLSLDGMPSDVSEEKESVFTNSVYRCYSMVECIVSWDQSLFLPQRVQDHPKITAVGTAVGIQQIVHRKQRMLGHPQLGALLQKQGDVVRGSHFGLIKKKRVSQF